MASTESEPMYSELNDIKTQEKDKLPFFRQNLDACVPPETTDMLEKYSKIPREKQSEHIHRIRDIAWNFRSWPCIGMGTWLVPQLRRQSFYPEIQERVKAGAVLMDIGTFIGHDIRRLAYDGAPSENLYGIDIANHFDTGYEFFRDRDTFEGHFILADFLNSGDSPELAALKSDKVDVIVISQVLHQWNLAHQFTAAKALVEYSKPGTWIVGNQVGNHVSQEFISPGLPTPMYRQNPESFAKLWDEVGAATGTRWETQAKLRPLEELGWDPNDTAWLEDGTALLEFKVKRLS